MTQEKYELMWVTDATSIPKMIMIVVKDIHKGDIPTK